MVRTQLLLSFFAAFVLVVSPLKASPVDVEGRDVTMPPNYVGFPEVWAEVQANMAANHLQPRSPVTLNADIQKVKLRASQKFCQAWLQGATPPRPTITKHATLTKVRSVTTTATVPVTRTVTDTTKTSLSTSVTVVDEARVSTSTTVTSTTVIVPETTFTSETLTVSFTDTSTPFTTESSATPTVTLSPTVSTETILTTSTTFLIPTPPAAAVVPRANRPAKPANIRPFCDEAVTKGCLLKLYGVLSYPTITKTCSDLRTTQIRTTTVSKTNTIEAHVTVNTLVVVPSISTRTVPTATTTTSTALTSTTTTATVSLSFTESETTTTIEPTSTTTVDFTTFTTTEQTATTTTVVQATATAFLLKVLSDRFEDSSVIGTFYRIIDNDGTLALGYAATQDTASKFFLTAEGQLKSLDGTLTLVIPTTGIYPDPKLAMRPNDQVLTPPTCKLTPAADPLAPIFSCTYPDPTYGLLSVFWYCGTTDILGIETEFLGCNTVTLVAVPVDG